MKSLVECLMCENGKLPKDMQIIIGMAYKYLDENSPFTYTNNGVYDLNQQGKKGFAVWVGFKHAIRGRQPVNIQKMKDFIYDHAIKDFVQEVNEITGKHFSTDNVVVEDFWKKTDMFRLYITV